MLDEPARRGEAEPGNAAGHQIGAVGSQGEFGRAAQADAGIAVRRQHQLADMTGGLHQAEGLADRREREGAMRERPDRAFVQRRRNLGEQRARQIGPLDRQLVDVDREVRDVLAQRPQVDAAVQVEVALAEFEEAAERLQAR